MAERPTYDELVRRIEALEERQLKVADLPRAGIKRWLENEWSGNTSELILPGSIETELLVDGDQLPTDDQKAALAGRAGMIGSRTNAPSDSERYLLESNLYTKHADTPSNGASTFYEVGLWIVSSHYGFSYDGPMTRAGLVYMTHYTDGSGARRVGIIAQMGFANNVTTTYTVVNDATTTGHLRVNTSHGNTRTFFVRVNPKPVGVA